MILLPYRFCGDSHHAFAFPFVLIFLPLRLSCKESSTSNQAFSIVFTTPSVPLIGDRNLRRKDVTALLGARNRYALRLADHQRSSPDCAGWDRLEWHFLAVLYKPKVRLCSCRLYTNRKTLCFHSFVIIIACK